MSCATSHYEFKPWRQTIIHTVKLEAQDLPRPTLDLNKIQATITTAHLLYPAIGGIFRKFRMRPIEVSTTPCSLFFGIDSASLQEFISPETGCNNGRHRRSDRAPTQTFCCPLKVTLLSSPFPPVTPSVTQSTQIGLNSALAEEGGRTIDFNFGNGF